MCGCNFHPIKGVGNWWDLRNKIRDSAEVAGLERVFVRVVHFLHIFTVSGWIKFAFDPLPDDTHDKQLRCRNIAVEIWVFSELVVFLFLNLLSEPIGWFRLAVAAYFLFEIILNLCSIIFVGKLASVYPPTSSIERSLLLFGINVLQVIFIFAIFYRATLGLKTGEAIFHAILVLGTVGYPPLHSDYYGWWVIALQILTGLGLLAVFLGAFVGNLRAFRKRDESQRSEGID
jgi:hypothetical protein